MTEMTDTIEAPTGPTDQSEMMNPSPSGFRRLSKRLGWIVSGFLLLIFFTVVKLPEERIKNYIQGSITSLLSEQGISFSAAESSLSMWFGISYVMKDVTLHFTLPDSTARIEKISFSPSITDLIFGKVGGSFSVVNGDGKFTGSFAMKQSQASLSFTLKDFDLKKLGVLPAVAGLTGAGMLNGSASLAGDFNNPATMTGAIDLSLGKVDIEPQTIAGFSIPRIAISEGKIDLAIDKGKAQIKTLRLGKTGNAADDIQATLTGDITLKKTWDSSDLNLKSQFSLSENILKSFVLIDAFLGPGKQPDGSYAFNITGPMYAPTPMPVTR